jgi:hypothetical protein
LTDEVNRLSAAIKKYHLSPIDPEYIHTTQVEQPMNAAPPPDLEPTFLHHMAPAAQGELGDEAPNPGMEPQPGMEQMPLDPMMAQAIRNILREERQKEQKAHLSKKIGHFRANLSKRIGKLEATYDLAVDDHELLMGLLERQRSETHQLYQKIRSGDLSREDARAQYQKLRASTASEITEKLGEEVGGVVDQLSPLPRRGPFANQAASPPKP